MSRWKVCAEPGCPELHEKPRGYCEQHERQRDRARGSRQQRGYDSEHDKLRASTAQRVDREGFTCWRCGTRFPPGTRFDLGHDDHYRSVYRGAECLPCNRSTASRR